MKIYHTETQADYDALMVELEAQGCKWLSGLKPTETTTNWKIYSSEMCVKVEKKEVMYAGKSYYTSGYPEIQITKYKAKVDERMKFTKENVYKLFEDYLINKNGIHRFNDLESAVMDLDDTPEKVVVPKCFDEWFKEIEIEAEYPIPDNPKTFALWKLCQQGFGYGFEDVHGKTIPYNTDLGEWLLENKMLAIDAVLNGYEVEKEPLYVVRFMECVEYTVFERDEDGNITEDGTCKCGTKLTEKEIKAIDERYWAFAKPIEEEEE